MTNSDAVADYVLLLETNLDVYEQALNKAGKDYGFKPDEYLISLEPQRKDAGLLVMQKLLHDFREYRTQQEGSQNVLLAANHGLIEQRDVLKPRLAAVQSENQTLLSQHQLQIALMQTEHGLAISDLKAKLSAALKSQKAD